jgi:hypothetical protein
MASSLYSVPIGDFGAELEFLAFDEPLALTVTTNADQVAQALLQLAGYVSRVQVPLLAAREIAADETARLFDEEVDVDGEPWAENNEDYKEWKESKGKDTRVMHKEGFLADAAPTGWRVVGNTLVYDTTVLPEAESDQANYGLINHFGGERSPFGKAATEFFKSADIELLMVPIVPRRFIGLTEDAQDLIIAEFTTWLEEGLEEFDAPVIMGPKPGTRAFYESRPGSFYIRPSGVVQTRLGGGRFGPTVARL